jgi:iron complex outermembrane receptor protein
MTFRQLRLSGIALVVFLSGSPAWAQSEGRLSGVVRDATSVGIPGVTVVATHDSTKESVTATTDGEGRYMLSLPPGPYTVSASVPNFRRGSQTVAVAAGASNEIDFLLQPQLSEAITVTATKREQELIDVPFSVAAPTEEVLRSRGVEDIEGIAANVAGLTVQNLGPGQSQVAMRGVSAGQIVRDQPGVKEQVGVYLDESVISLSLFTPDLDLFDLNRVEVLRGPQGTLFGSGSLSGTVRYITNQPEMGVTRGFAEVGASGVAGGNLGAIAKLGFNVPLGDTAALRVATYYDRIAGYIDAVQPGLDVEDDVNDGFRTGLRALVKIAPTERLTITPRIVYQRVKMGGWNRIDDFNILANPFTTSRPPVTFGEREQFTQLEEDFTDDFVLGDVNITYDLGDLAVASNTSYTNRDVLVVRDATALTASITGGSLGLPERVYTLDAPLLDATTASIWTQELRVLSSDDKRVPWVAGVFFSHGDRDYDQNLPVAGFEDLSGVPTRGLRAPKDTLFFSDLGYTLNQIAFFGEATVPLTDRFSVTGGLRYYHFDEDKEQVFDGIFANDDTGTRLVTQPGSTDADGLAPRVIASYKLTENAHLNGQVSRGFRLGGINDPLNVPLCTPQDLVTFGGRETWKDETVWNYEVGVKSQVLNGRGALNVAAFYMDIHDLQATVTAGSCSSRVIFNVPKARSQGFEIGFETAVNPNLDFAISASVTDAELRSTLTSTDPSGAVSIVSGIEEGRRRGPRHARPAVVRSEFDRWAVDGEHVHIRPGAAGL